LKVHISSFLFIYPVCEASSLYAKFHFIYKTNSRSSI